MNRTKTRALVVEDDLSIQEEIEDVLSAMGHDCKGRSNCVALGGAIV